LVRTVVLSAAVQDWDGLQDLCGQLAPVSPRLQAGWVDGGFAAGVVAVAERFGWQLAVVTKEPGQRGFVVQPRRWVVERTFAWLTTCRRLAKDYEVYTETSEAFIYLAMIQLMLRRLAPDPANQSWKAGLAACSILKHALRSAPGCLTSRSSSKTW
jgi:putative transposase